MTESFADDSDNHSLADEDAQLLWQATARAEALLDELTTGRPPGSELDALLGYLREVVLGRINEEDRRMFPLLGQTGVSPSDLERLRNGHLVLRDGIDDLAAAAGALGPGDPDRLAAVTRRLIVDLEEHLRKEAAVFATLPGGRHAESSEWAGAAHWYPLTEGSVIELDQLRPDQAENAVLNRLTHLRPGEHVQLRGHEDPQRLWHRLQRRAPSDYSWSQRPDDAAGWVADVTRRPVD